MRWVTYTVAGGDGERAERVGVVGDGAVHALEPGTALIDLLGDDGSRLRQAGERALSRPADVHELADIEIGPPIPQPRAVRDFSSFEEHIRNGLEAIGQKLGEDWYEIPVFYFSNPTDLIGTKVPVLAPGNTERLDYELEVAVVMGRMGRDLDAATAEDYIAGMCIYNDWSARDLQTREQRTVPIGPAKGKDFANGFGPYLVTWDEFQPHRKDKAFDLAMTASVNGKVLSRGNLADLYWSWGEMLAYASRNATLMPGDLIGCGTCGSGCILELSLRFGGEAYPWLHEGDQVVLEVDGLGQLENTVTFSDPPSPLR